MIETPTFKFAIAEKLAGTISFLPKKAHNDDTGFDVRAAETVILRAGQYAKIPLGFRMFAPKGWWVELRPRSSTFAKKQLHSLYGTIDEGFSLEAHFCCQYLPDISAMGRDLQINFGDAIGQIVPVRRQEMAVELVSNEEYDRLVAARNSDRKGGFGSSDKKANQ